MAGEDCSSSAEMDALVRRLRLHRPPPSPYDPEPDAVSVPATTDDGELFRPRRAAVLVCLFRGDGGELRVILTKRSSSLSTHSGEVSLPGGKAEEGDADDAATALRESKEEIGLDPTLVTVVTSLEHLLSKVHAFSPHLNPYRNFSQNGCIAQSHDASVEELKTLILLLSRLCNQTCMCSQINFTPYLLIEVLIIIHRFFLAMPHSTVIPFSYNFRITIILHPAQICITILPISWITIHLLVVVPVVGILLDRQAFKPVLNIDEVDEIFDVPLEMFLKDENRTSEEREKMGQIFTVQYFTYENGIQKYLIWGLTARILIEAASVVYQRPPDFTERRAYFKLPKFTKDCSSIVAGPAKH